VWLGGAYPQHLEAQQATEVLLLPLLSMRLLLSAGLAASSVNGQHSMRWNEVTWDFDEGTEGWANKTAEEMQCEVYQRGGELRGAIRGHSSPPAYDTPTYEKETGNQALFSRPFVDSPPMFVRAVDRHFIVVRMKYTGLAQTGRVIVRTGPSIPKRHDGGTGHQTPGSGVLGNTVQDRTEIAQSTTPFVGVAFQYVDDNMKFPVESAVTHWKVFVKKVGTVRLQVWRHAGGNAYNLVGENVVPFTALGSQTVNVTAAERITAQKGDIVGWQQDSEGGIAYDTLDQDHWMSWRVASTDQAAPFASEGPRSYSIEAVYNSTWSQDSNPRSWSSELPDFESSDIAGTELPDFKSSNIPNYATPQDHPTLLNLDFEVLNDGRFHNYYIPLWKHFFGIVTQLRLHPAMATTGGIRGPVLGDTFALDWVKFAKAPTVRRVVGCIDKFYPTVNLGYGVSNLTTTQHVTNGFQYYYHTNHFPLSPGTVTREEGTYVAEGGQAFPYATSYNCHREGGQRISITGINFGASDAAVTVGGQPCTNVVHTKAETELQCTLPAGNGLNQEVHVTNGALTSLSGGMPYLSYAVAPPEVRLPTISNIAAHSMDLTWQPPEDYWDSVTVTGYSISRREGGKGVFGNEVTLGNVSTTTLIGLESDTLYEFRVAAVTEDYVTSHEWLHLDLYGRRSLLVGALEGPFSSPTNMTATLKSDIVFTHFDANSTVNYSAIESRATLGPTGVWGGEGHYGLIAVGDAGIENCNSSVACCDGYVRWAHRPSRGSDPTGTCPQVSFGCSGIGVTKPSYLNGTATDRNTTSNMLPSGIIKISKSSDIADMGDRPSEPCGPALRLTSSQARLSGASWYPRKLNVEEGFETIFKLRISNPSEICTTMDDVYTHCRARGADGFAFVIQNQHDQALGGAGSGLGYEGIKNSLAIEFDTWYNSELLDPFENHISIQTRGWRDGNNANHTFSLGSTTKIADLVSDVHVVKVKYTPIFDEDSLFMGNFEPSPYSAHFMENADHSQGGQSDWGTGMGTMSLYYDNMEVPVLTIPLNLGATMDLDYGRAWLGFTASTGDNMYQVHDVLDWSFNSLRQDVIKLDPDVVNGVGAHSCNDPMECVHH
jgi:hypothetical protein